MPDWLLRLRRLTNGPSQERGQCPARGDRDLTPSERAWRYGTVGAGLLEGSVTHAARAASCAWPSLSVSSMPAATPCQAVARLVVGIHHQGAQELPGQRRVPTTFTC